MPALVCIDSAWKDRNGEQEIYEALTNLHIIRHSVLAKVDLITFLDGQPWTMDRKIVTVLFLTISKSYSLLPIVSFKVKKLALIYNIMM